MNITKKHIHLIKNTNAAKDSFVSIIILADRINRDKKNNISYLSTVKNKSIIDIQLSHILNTFKNSEIIISINNEQHDLLNYIKSSYASKNIRFIENCSTSDTNDSESLRLCLNNIYNDKIIVIKGGILFPLHDLSKIDLNKSGIIIGPLDQRFEVGVIYNEKQNLDHLGFGLSNSWMEIFWINNTHGINVLRSIVSSKLYKKKFIFEALNDLVELKKHKLHTHFINNITTNNFGGI
jgi:hypothetical protein